MKVHPLADSFPLMTSAEIADLAKDIEANGLAFPVVTRKGTGGPDDELIDGRNRLRACEAAKVTPRFVALNGADASAFILSANIARRQMTKGALAMVVAKAYPEPASGGRGKNSPVTGRFPMIGQQRLSEARTVVQWAPELVDAVIEGGRSLDEALRVAKQRKDEESSEASKLDQLKAGSTDIFELVRVGKLDLEEGLAALNERKRQEHMIRETGRTAASRALAGFCADVVSIESAIKLGEKGILDADRVQAVVTAASRLQQLVKEQAP